MASTTSKIMLYFNMSVTGQQQLEAALTGTSSRIAQAERISKNYGDTMGDVGKNVNKIQIAGHDAGISIRNLAFLTGGTSKEWLNLSGAVQGNISRMKDYTRVSDRSEVALRNNVAGVIRTDRAMKRLARTEATASKGTVKSQKISDAEAQKKIATQAKLQKQMSLYQGNVKGLMEKEWEVGKSYRGTQKELRENTKAYAAKTKQMMGTLHTNESLTKAIKEEQVHGKRTAQIRQSEVRQMRILNTAKSGGLELDKKNTAMLKKLENPHRRLKRDLADLSNKEKIYGENVAITRQKMDKLLNLQRTGKLHKSEQKELGKLTQKYKDQSHQMGRNIVNMAKWAAGYFFLYRAIRLVTGGISASLKVIIEVDKALTVIRAISGATATDMRLLSDAALEMAKKFGISVKTVVMGMELWARQGKTTVEIMELMNSVLLLSNVSGLSAAESTSFMTAALNQFNLEASESLRIVDTLVALDARYAASTAEIATGLQIVGATANEMGVSLEETSSLMAALIEKTRRGGSEVGRALRMIFVRTFRPETLDDMYALAQVTGTATKGNRELIDVLGDLAAKWDELTDSERLHLAQRLAGVRQVDKFLGLMANFPRVLEGVEIATMASGEAIERNSIIMQSMSKNLDVAKAKFEANAIAIGQGGLAGAMSFFIDVASKTLSIFGEIPAHVSAGTIVTIALTGAVVGLGFALRALVKHLSHVQRSVALTKIAVGGLAFVLVDIVASVAFWAISQNKLVDTTERSIKSVSSARDQLRSYSTQLKRGNLDELGRIAVNEKAILIINKYAERYKALKGVTDPGIAAGLIERGVAADVANAKERMLELDKLIEQRKKKIKELNASSDKDLGLFTAAIAATFSVAGAGRQPHIPSAIEEEERAIKSLEGERRVHSALVNKAADEMKIENSAILEVSIAYRKLAIAQKLINEEYEKNNLLANRIEITDRIRITGLRGLAKEQSQFASDQKRAAKGKIDEINYQGKLRDELTQVRLIREKLRTTDDYAKFGALEYKDALDLLSKTTFKSADVQDRRKKAILEGIVAEHQLSNVIEQSRNRLEEYNVTLAKLDPQLEETIGLVHELFESFLMATGVEGIAGVFETMFVSLRQQIVETIVSLEVVSNVVTSLGGVIKDVLGKPFEVFDKDKVDDRYWDLGLNVGSNAAVGFQNAITGLKIGNSVGHAAGVAFAVTADNEMAGAMALIGANVGATIGQEAGLYITRTASAGLQAVVPGILSAAISIGLSLFLRAVFSDAKEEATKQTREITSEIGNTNAQLDITNRLLTDIRDKIEPYPLPESFYFQNLPQFGNGGTVPGPIGTPQVILAHGGEEISMAGESRRVSIDSININISGDANADDIVNAIDDAFNVSSSRIYQGVR